MLLNSVFDNILLSSLSQILIYAMVIRHSLSLIDWLFSNILTLFSEKLHQNDLKW